MKVKIDFLDIKRMLISWNKSKMVGMKLNKFVGLKNETNLLECR